MTEQEAKVLKYSRNSSQASLWQFKQVIETGELRYLLILDDYESLPLFDLELLKVAWQNIYQGFSDIVGGSRADLWLLKIKRLSILQLKYAHHSAMLRAVNELQHPDLISLINDEGYNIDINDFEKTAEKAYTQLMRLKNQISIEVKEREREDNQENDIDDLIVTLEKFQGYQFDEYKMTVKKFANIYKKYKDGEAA